MQATSLLPIDTLRAGLLFFAGLSCLTSVYGDDRRFSAYLTASTVDMFRGIQRHDKPVALQAAVRYAASDSLGFAVEVHDTEFMTFTGGSTDETEVNYSVAYAKQVSQAFAWQVTFTRYSFPGSSDAFFEYDFNELSLYLELPRNFGLALSTSDTNFNFTKGLAYGELTWRTAIPYELELSAAIGATKALSGSRRGYAYWDTGVSRYIGQVAVDLRYHYSPYDRNWFGRAPARGEWALSVTQGW